MADNFDLKGWMQDNKQGPYKLNEHFGGGYVDLKPLGYLREEEEPEEKDNKKGKEKPGQKGSKGIPHELASWIDDEEGQEYDKHASKNYDDMESGAGLEEEKTGYPAAFLKWVKSDSVVKTKEGYKEQMGQYKKVFKTLADLYKHYQKEYSMDEDVAVGPGIDGGTSLPEIANTDVDTVGYYDVTLHNGQKFKNVKFRTTDSFDTADGKTMMHQDIAKATQSYPGGHGLNEVDEDDIDEKEFRENIADYFYKTLGGHEIDSIEFEGVVYVDGKNKCLFMDGEKITPTKKQLEILWQEHIDNEGGLESLYEAKPHVVDRKYTHFAVNKKTGKIVTGWNYKGVDKEEIPHWTKIDLKDMDLKPAEFSILSKAALEKKGIDPFDHVKNWTAAHTVSESSSPEEVKHDHYYEMARGYKDDGMSMGEVEAKLDDMGCKNATDIALDLFPDDEEGDEEEEPDMTGDRDLEEADLYKENLARFKRK